MNIESNLNQKGFTLIELAIVLVIVGVLVGSFVGTLTQRIENSRIAETEDELDDIKTALIGYAYTYGYLPCSDCFPGDVCTGGINGDGIEDRNVDACSNDGVGTLPWVTLGLADNDAWGTRYRYAVDATYSDRAAANIFTLASAAGAGEILERSDDGTVTQQLADNIVAVVISHGKNGYGGINLSGVANAAIPAANIDEIDNLNADNDFISRPPTSADTTTDGGEFDDILVWISEFELKAKMVEAGRLP